MIPFYRPPDLLYMQEDYLVQQFRIILNTKRFHKGKNVQMFEDEICEYLGVNYAFTCGSGTIALVLALRVLLGSPTSKTLKRVALPYFNWIGVHKAVQQAGCWPKYTDIDPKTLFMSTTDEILRFCEVLLPTHTFGNICEIEAKPNQKILYDSAHAWGAEIKDFGDISVFSLAPPKNLTSMEGGVLVTNDLKIAKKIKYLRDIMSRMSEVHAVVGLAYLEILPKLIKVRKENWEYYTKELPKHYPLELQIVPYSHSYNYFGAFFEIEDYNSVKRRLENKVDLRYYYSESTSHDPYLKETNRIAKGIIQFPIYEKGIARRVIRCLE